MQLPVVKVFLSGVPAHEDGEEGHQRRRTPDHRQHNGQFSLSHYERIVERLHDSVIAVDADAAEVEDGHGGEVDVQGVPDIAHEVSEEPPALGDLDAEVEAHGPDGDQHVGQGQ